MLSGIEIFNFFVSDHLNPVQHELFLKTLQYKGAITPPPPPSFVVSISIIIKFGVLIGFDKFSPK